jgi:DeoR/GlpR family transcriptional regulator of sugar metabolism
MRESRIESLDSAHFASQHARMPQNDRLRTLVLRLREDGQVSVPVLARELGVTQSTIRRDLSRLAIEGSVVRTYGGAALPGATRTKSDDSTSQAKRAIALAASQLIEDGQTVAISSGSTTMELARRLVDRRLTVITNALDVANVLIDREGIELIILGGVVRPRMHSMLGHLAELALGELRADTLFMGIGAIDPERGLMNDSVPEILTDRALRAGSRNCVVLADSTKFCQVAPAFVFGLDQVNTVVTDAGVEPADVSSLRAHNVRVIVTS